MSKLLSLSLVALLAIGSIVPLTTSMATAKGTCGTDHACPPGNPGDPGNPGTPGDPGDPGDPGGPGNNQPYEDPTVTVADNTPSMLIACRTRAGDDDLRFRNIGDLVIPGGTRVYWLVKETGDHGYFFLPADLKVGETVIDADALTLGTPDVMHCYSRLM